MAGVLTNPIAPDVALKLWNEGHSLRRIAAMFSLHPMYAKRALARATGDKRTYVRHVARRKRLRRPTAEQLDAAISRDRELTLRWAEQLLAEFLQEGNVSERERQ
jgi:hypothetical protein